MSIQRCLPEVLPYGSYQTQAVDGSTVHRTSFRYGNSQPVGDPEVSTL